MLNLESFHTGDDTQPLLSRHMYGIILLREKKKKEKTCRMKRQGSEDKAGLTGDLCNGPLPKKDN